MKKILIVEDEPLLAMTQQKTLERIGYISEVARTGEHAIEKCSNGCEADLILMDINLGPGIDGTEAAKEILSKKDIPIVFHSSHQEPEIVEKTEKITSYGYVVKGSSVTVLDASIKMAFKLHEAKKGTEKVHQFLDKASENVPGTIYQYKISEDGIASFPFATEKIYDVYEVTPEEVEKDASKVFERLHPEDLERVKESIYKSHKELSTWEYDYRVILPKKGERWLSGMANPERVKDGVLWHGYIWDSTERKLAEEELKIKSLVLDQIRDRVTVTDLEGNITYINNAEKETLKFPEDIIGKSVEVFGDTPERGVTQKEIVEKTITEGRWTGEVINISSEGEEIVYETKTQLIKDENNNPIAMAGITLNITEEKEEERMREKKLDENRIILREAHHRMKNSFASIESIISLQMGNVECQESHEVLIDLLGRVKSMRLVYDKILETQEFNKISVRNYFESFIEAIISVFQNGSKISIEKDIDNIELSSKVMFPLGVIANEFITNSMKYAFTSGEKGHISLSISKNKNGNIDLHLSDDGKGMPEELINDPGLGFGMVLIHSMCQQLNSKYELYNDNGFNLKLSFKPV